MTIKLDGESLLKVLARWGDEFDADFGGLGHHRVESSEVHQSKFSRWSIPRYNDAIRWLRKKRYLEDDDTLGSAPYEMRSLLLTTDGRMAAEPFVNGIDTDAVHMVNANARRLLVHLHALYLAAQGKQFAATPDAITLAYLSFDKGTYMQASHRLIERDLAKWLSNGGSLTITRQGLRAVESPDRLAHELPVSADDEDEEEEGQAMVSKPDKKMAAVYALNHNARTLLARLHDARLDVGGADFTFFYDADLPFDFEAYKAAALRLTERDLARYKGQTEITITALGVQASEDDGAMLDRVLPLGPPAGMVDGAERRTTVGDQGMATRIFISHSHGDKPIAKALIGLIEAGLEVPTRMIRCTSVEGYTLEGGDPAPKVLRENLKECNVVLVVLTQKSLASSYVLMELGAAWAFEKRAMPLVGPGATLSDLPGPFKDLHGLKMDDSSDMGSIIDTVAKDTNFVRTHNQAKIQAALRTLDEAVTASAAPGVSPPPPFRP